MRVFCFFYIFCLAVVHLAAQTLILDSPPTVRVGVLGGANATLHLPSFTKIPGYQTTFLPYTPAPELQNDASFRSSLALGIAAGALVEIPFSNALYFGLRGVFATHSGVLRAAQRFYTTDANGGEYYPTVEHTLSFALSTLNVEAMLAWKPQWEALPNVVLSVGAAAAMPIADLSFVQTARVEAAQSPVIPMLNVNTLSGTLPFSALNFSVLGGLGYEVPMPLGAGGTGGQLLVVPEVQGLLGITSGLSDGGAWNMAQLRATIGLRYEFPRLFERGEEMEKIDTVRKTHISESLVLTSIPDSLIVGVVRQERDTAWVANIRTVRLINRRTDTLIATQVVKRKPKMQFSLVAMGVNADGKEVAMPEVRVEEIIGQKYFPLLGYVFFDERSAVLPMRYTLLTREQSANFTTLSACLPGALKRDPLMPYHQLLNILGERLKRFPKATITLTGCNAGAGAEQGNTALSEARAKAVKQYLCDVWAIEPERMTTKARNMPEKPSLPTTEADKRAENRRVEITSTTPEVLEWVIIADTLHTLTPNTARFITHIESESLIRSWRLAITYNGDTVRTFDSTGAPPQTFDWDFGKEFRAAGRDLRLLTNSFVLLPQLTDDDGSAITSEAASLPVKQVTVQKKRRERKRDKEFEEFSMMLFEFNESRASQAQASTIDFIKSHLKVLSELAVVGYTDRTGSAEYNRKLSLERARQIARAITGEESPSEQVIVRGVGSDEILFDNIVPEGRFYCRTVKVTVETPVNR